MTRQPSAVFAGLCTVAMMLCGAFAAAQESRAPLARLTPTPRPTADNGYWIISSRELEGGLDRSQRPHYHVLACTADGRRHSANVETLVQSLTPGVPVCFVLHGSFVDWDTVLADSRHTNAWLRGPCPDRPLHVVFFTWPSDDTPKLIVPIDIALLGRRSSRHSLYVAELISLIPDDHPICLVGHSHGARMAVSALHVLGGGKVDDVGFGGGPYYRHRLRAVLAAGAFDHDWLNPGARYDHALLRSEAILNLRNRRDFALGFYPLHRPFTAPAAGRRGFSDADRQRLGESSQKLLDLDVTPYLRQGHIWPHYYVQPRLAQVIAPHVFFLEEGGE